MRKRCGTQIPDTDYLPKPGEEGFHILVTPKVSLERIPDSEIPNAPTLRHLARVLSDRTASEIVRILASEGGERRYGPSVSVLCEIAEEFSISDPQKAFLLHKEAWERTSDPRFLSKLVPLAAASGRVADAASYLRTARYLGIDVDASPLLSAAGFPEAAPLFEFALSEAVTADPSIVAWIPDRDRSNVLAKYWRSFAEAPPPTPAERLERLEFAAITMLDPESFFEFCEEFARTATDPKLFSELAEYAQSEPSKVSEAYFLAVNPDAGPFGHWTRQFQTPSVLRRRLFHAVHHFSDLRFIPAFRNLRDAFSVLEPSDESAFEDVSERLERVAATYARMPQSLLAYRERTLGEISRVHGSSYYLRLFSRAFGMEKPFSVPGERTLAILVSDGLLRGMEFNAVSELSDRLAFVCSDPDAAYLVGASFALVGHYYEAVEWLSKSRLSSPEPLSLLLRIAAEMPDLADMAVEAISNGLPVPEVTAPAALSMVRSVASSVTPDLSGEIVGDAEKAFGDPDIAVSSYLRASEFGNEEAMKKAADLWYAMGRFKKAHALYERLVVLIQKSPKRNAAFSEIEMRLCLGSLAKGDRKAAAAYLERLDPTDPENAEAFARFHCVRDCPQELFAGLKALSSMPYGAASELPSDLLRTYRRFASGFASGLPKIHPESSPSEMETEFTGMFTALRSLPFSLDGSVSDAVEYVAYVERMLSVSLKNSNLGNLLLGELSGVLTPIHKPAHSSGDVESDAPAPPITLDQLFLSEAKTLVSLFSHLAIDQGEERIRYVRLLLSVSNTLDMLGDSESAGYFRHSAAWVAEGGTNDFNDLPPSASLH